MRPSPRRPRSGIAAPDLLPSGRWRYRVWDPAARRYLAATFLPADGKGEPDEHRRDPGCAEGDGWASREQARVRLGLSTARVATLEAVGQAYVEQRIHLDRADAYIGTIRHTLAWAAAQGVADLGDPGICPLLQSRLRALQACRRGQVTPRPASPRTKNQHIAILQALGDFAVRKGHCLRDPFAGLEAYTEGRRDRKVYTLAELRRLLSDAARDQEHTQRAQLDALLVKHAGNRAAVARELDVHQSTVTNRLKGEPRADPWWLFVCLAAYTGFRSETLRSLTWGMVDWQANRIRVPAAITKTSSDIRAPIQPELAAILRALPRRPAAATILPADDAAVDSDVANARTQAYLRRHGVEPGGRSVHIFRHTVVALRVATGQSHFAVMDAVGHSSTQTSKHYARMADDFREQVHKEGWEEGVFYLRRPPPRT